MFFKCPVCQIVAQFAAGGSVAVGIADKAPKLHEVGLVAHADTGRNIINKILTAFPMRLQKITGIFDDLPVFSVTAAVPFVSCFKTGQYARKPRTFGKIHDAPFRRYFQSRSR